MFDLIDHGLSTYLNPGLTAIRPVQSTTKRTFDMQTLYPDGNSDRSDIK